MGHPPPLRGLAGGDVPLIRDWRERFRKGDPRRRLETSPESGDQMTRYGFRWGPFELQRMADIKYGRRRYYVVSFVTDAGQLLEVYISGRGRSVRAYLNHVELTAAKAGGDGER